MVLGQGTVGVEIMDQHPDVSTIVVAIGGGGLAAGVAVAAKLTAQARGKKIRIIGVQAENVAPYPVSLKAGKITEIVATPTIADGIAVAKPGRVPHPERDFQQMLQSHLFSFPLCSACSCD